VMVHRLERASTCLTPSRKPAASSTTPRPWYSAPVTAPAAQRRAGSQTSTSDSCFSVEDATTTAAPVSSDTTTALRRRHADETLIDLTTLATSQCLPSDDTPRRRTSDITLAQAQVQTQLEESASRPSSGRHSVLPPIRTLRSVDTVVTVATPTVVLANDADEL